jgi:hypothetical protein
MFAAKVANARLGFRPLDMETGADVLQHIDRRLAIADGFTRRRWVVLV